MGTDKQAVEWYRSCIHERQRRANTLSIEVELNAREKDDPGALAEAVTCLDSAIRVLEQANGGLTDSEAHTSIKLQRPHRRTIPVIDSHEDEPLMEDLGHSMDSLDVGALPPRMPHRSRNGKSTRRHVLDLRRFPFENSLSFFQ